MDRKTSVPVVLNDCLVSELRIAAGKIEDSAPLTPREIRMAQLSIWAICDDFTAEENGRITSSPKHEFAPEEDYPFTDAYGMGELIDSNCNLRVRGKVVKVRWVNQWSAFKSDGGDDSYFMGLAYDPRGTFYGITGVGNPPDIRKLAIEKFDGKRALL